VFISCALFLIYGFISKCFEYQGRACRDREVTEGLFHVTKYLFFVNAPDKD
jgi:hypothetical protein